MLELFGPGRCMFESNFPVDRSSASYCVVWNALKRLAVGASIDERRQLFRENAARNYRIDL
jgi:predicted TIM-barrel fold metal-dependent hydrolase